MSDLNGSPQSGPRGRAAILSFQVLGPEGAAVVVALDHRDPGGTWSSAGSLSMIGPTDSALRVSALKEQMRFRIVGGPAQVRVLPPEWLPC